MNFMFKIFIIIILRWVFLQVHTDLMTSEEDDEMEIFMSKIMF